MDVLNSQKAIDNIRTGLIKYNYLRTQLHKTNVATDVDFQKTFNGFYRMRQRSQEYYLAYFDYMEKMKNSGVTFEETLRFIFNSVGRIEPSFSSKLVATIDPNKPVWDEFVLKNLNLVKPSTYCKDRIEKTISVYKDIEQFYIEFLSTNKCKELISIFESHFPNMDITNVKKIDLMLWQMRD